MSNTKNKRSTHNRKKRLNFKVLIPSIILIFLVFFIPISISNSGYKGLMKNYCKSIVKQNYELYKSSFPSFVTENGLENLMIFTYDNGENYMQNIYDSYTETYGKNLKISYKIINRTKLSKEELSNYSESATALCTDGSEIKIKKGYRLNLSMKYKGKIGNTTKELSVVVIKYSGNWYIYDGDIFFC